MGDLTQIQRDAVSYPFYVSTNFSTRDPGQSVLNSKFACPRFDNQQLTPYEWLQKAQLLALGLGLKEMPFNTIQTSDSALTIRLHFRTQLDAMRMHVGLYGEVRNPEKPYIVDVPISQTGSDAEASIDGFVSRIKFHMDLYDIECRFVETDKGGLRMSFTSNLHTLAILQHIKEVCDSLRQAAQPAPESGSVPLLKLPYTAPK